MMSSLSIFARGFSLLIVISFIPSIYANTSEEQVPFDLRQVIEQVSHHPKIDGNTIKINGRFYEAKFEKDGIVLNERNTGNRFKICFEEETGDVTVNDEEVRYRLKDGVFSVKGRNRGLQFRKEIKESGERTADGVRFRVRTEGKEARIGEISVTDASGYRFKPEVSKKHDGTDILIPEKEKSKLKFPLTLTGEFMIDTTIVCYPSYEWEENFCSVAFDGTNFFVVWGNNDLEAVVGTRVSQTGEVLDKAGIRIMEETTVDEKTSVAFNGENYLVVWSDEGVIIGFRVSPNGNVLNTTPIYIGEGYYTSIASDGSNFLVVWSEWGINGVRVSNSGTILDTILICTAANNPFEPSVCFGGSNYLVAWRDYRNGNHDIYGARLTTSGSVLDPTGIAISTLTSSQCRPTVTFGGGNYFIVWDDYRSGIDRDIYGARVTQAGSVLDATGIDISTATDWQMFPAVSFDGSNYFAVWLDNAEIYGARISTSGTVLDSSGILITRAYPGISPSVTFGISNYMVVWAGSYYDIYGARVNTAGTVLDTSGILLSMQVNEQYYPQVAFDGTNYLVVWEDRREPFDIYGARVSSAGGVLDPSGIPICNATGYQYKPDVTFDGTNYFVVWEDRRNGVDQDIYGARVNTAGVVLDLTGISISNAVNNQANPQVIFAGGNYFVAWQDWRLTTGSDIYGARVSSAGTVLDPSGIPISTATNDQSYLQIVFGGNNYFVVWQDRRAGNWDIYGARVNSSGTILDPSGILISSTTDNQGLPRVAFDGTNYLVVWDDYRPGGMDVYGARVSTTGIVLNPTGIPISTAINNQGAPRLAFDGTNYLVVWHDARNGPLDIYGARVNTSGNVLDPAGIAISTASATQYYPNVIFDGTDYLVLWKDNRYAGTLSDLCGAKVTSSGTVTEFAVSIMPGELWNFTLAKGPGNQVLVVWQGWTFAPYYAYRIWGKLLPEQVSGWQTMAPIPPGASGKRPKYGSCMAGLQAVGKIYFLKASNTPDFHVYTPDEGIGSWTDAEPMPLGEKVTGDGKKPKKGAAMTAYQNVVFVLRGNNTLGFWKYVALGTNIGWQKLKNISEGAKKPKQGSGLAAVSKGGKDYIFAMKGSRTSEFYLYDIAADSWIKITNAPIGTSGKVGYKKGSCLCYDGNDLVYVLQGYYGSFFSYSLEGDSWHQLKQYNYKTMVNRDGKKKKPKDGAALVYCFNNIYLLKGGNTREVWMYSIAADSWYQMNPGEVWDIPFGASNKKVKDGGNMIMFRDYFYASKGKNTNEFYRHTLPSAIAYASTEPTNECVMANQMSIRELKLMIAPNPAINNTTVKYSLPTPGEVSLKLYNVTGSLIKSYSNPVSTTNGIFHIDTKTLPSGIYLLRLVSSDYQTTRKLIIQK